MKCLKNGIQISESIFFLYISSLNNVCYNWFYKSFRNESWIPFDAQYSKLLDFNYISNKRIIEITMNQKNYKIDFIKKTIKDSDEEERPIIRQSSFENSRLIKDEKKSDMVFFKIEESQESVLKVNFYLLYNLFRGFKRPKTSNIFKKLYSFPIFLSEEMQNFMKNKYLQYFKENYNQLYGNELSFEIIKHILKE